MSETKTITKEESSRLLEAPAIAESYGCGQADKGGSTMTSGTTTSKKLPQVFAALTAAGGALAAGSMLGWTSPVQSAIVTDSQLQFNVTNEQFSWIGSTATLGAAFTCIPIGILLPILGRKLIMILLILPFLIGWGCLILATNVAFMIIGRILLGVASGGFCVAAPLYVGEIAQRDIRGTLGSFFQLLITVGILYVYIIGYFTNVFTTSLLCAIIPVIVGILLLLVPESPAYYISKGKKEQAVASFHWLRGNDYDASDEIADLQADCEKFKANPVSIGEALSRPVSRKALIISLGLMLFQQLSGINAVIFYTKEIFEYANTGLSAGVCTIIVGVVQIIATFISTLIVDKSGRRMLLLASSSVMAVCTFLMGIYFAMQENDAESVRSINWLPILCLCMFIVMFSIGFGPVPWLMMGEIFPSDIKGIAGSLAGTTNWCLAFVVSKTFVNLKEWIGIGPTFWLFSAITILGFVFVLFIVPETKGKSLTQIQNELEGKD